MKFKDIRKLVRLQNGRRPGISAISEAASTFTTEKKKVGRKVGWRKTSRAEDKAIMKTFHRVRPPGHGVTARKVHKGLPRKIRMKICKRTVITRLAEKGYTPKKKLKKNAWSTQQIAKRLRFGKKYLDWSCARWKSELQAVGDIKEFTWYPEDLRPRFYQLRADWTYMTDAERSQPEFQCPKRWFPKKDWQRTKKQNVFGITTSTGKQLSFLIPKPWNKEKWAELIRTKVAPFFKKVFPNRSTYTLLLDGEKILHAPVAKDAFLAAGVKIFPGWPGYSPDLNPQENVWAWAEEELRDDEDDKDTFEVFQTRVLKVVRKYPYGEDLVGGMRKRMRKLVDKEGGHIGK